MECGRPCRRGGEEVNLDKVFKDMMSFGTAQQKAEQEGRSEFECPLCGGRAWWSTSSYNNHLHCGCKQCGFKMME